MAAMGGARFVWHLCLVFSLFLVVKHVVSSQTLTALHNSSSFTPVTCVTAARSQSGSTSVKDQNDPTKQLAQGQQEKQSAQARREPESFCAATEPGRNHHILERQSVRDAICSNIGTNETVRLPHVNKNVTIVFYHFSKTGGESLERALRLPKDHRTYSERSSEHTRNYVALTIVRNPFDRMLSWFRFCLHGWRGRVPAPRPQCQLAFYKTERTLLHPNVTLTAMKQAFEEWLSLVLFHHDFVDPDKKIFYGYHTRLPQVHWIGGVHPLHLDYIIRFEHYSEDFEPLAKALGLNHTRLPRKNGSQSTNQPITEKAQRKFNVTYRPDVVEFLSTIRSYRDMYTDRAKSLVETNFAADLQYFQYSF